MHQHGYHVERRFGWDTHGLPVEYEIDKKLNIKGPEDVAKMGIEAYNSECRKIVMRYSKVRYVCLLRINMCVLMNEFTGKIKLCYFKLIVQV